MNHIFHTDHTQTEWQRFCPAAEEKTDDQDYQESQEFYEEHSVWQDAGSDPEFDTNNDGWYD